MERFKSLQLKYRVNSMMNAVEYLFFSVLTFISSVYYTDVYFI